MAVLRIKCTKFDFGWGAYSASPDPLAGFKGPTSKGRGYGKGGEEDGREGGGRGPQYFIAPLSSSFLEICLGITSLEVTSERQNATVM